MSVHYKFKSALEYDTVTFDGLHISVKDLKNAIIQQKRIGKSTDFDLQVTNAQTKEVYEDENALIPKNTSLLIARIPVLVQKTKPWEGYGGDSTPPPKIDEAGPIAKAVDLSSLDAPEDDKIKAMMSQSTQDYDPSNYVKIRGANQVGVVPPNYRCYKCHQGGHWIKDCTFGQGPEPMEIKKSTGIPRNFLVPVEGPQVPGAMMTPNGQYAVPMLDLQAYNQKAAPAPVPAPKVEIPEDLICSICQDLLTDAVMIPCCGNSFCDECIRGVLLESEDHECPDCHEKEISPDTLIPNRFLRTSVSNFKNTTGYVKKPTYRERTEPVRPQPTSTKEGTPPQEPESTEKLNLDEKTIISEADSTEHSTNNEGKEDDENKDSTKNKEAGSTPEGPPGVSPKDSPTRSPKDRNRPVHRLRSSRESTEKARRNSHGSRLQDDSPRKSSRNVRSPSFSSPRSREERSGTPTVDEPTNGVGYGPSYGSTGQPLAPGPVPVPGTVSTLIGAVPPIQGPPPHSISNTFPPGQPPIGNFPGNQGPLPNYRLPPPGSAPFMGPGPFPIPPRPMFDGSRPPIGGFPPNFNPNIPPGSRSHRDFNRRIRERTPPGLIDDPLAAFNRMLREKDERKRRAKRRSYSRSRSRSRSYSRSPVRRRASRSPRPSRRSRSRSRSFSLSRSRSRSYTGSPWGSPYNNRQASPPARRSPLVARRGAPTSRYRSPPPLRPSRSPPPRSRHPTDRHRDRDFEDDRDFPDRDRSYKDRNRDRERGRVSRDRRPSSRDRDRYYDNFDDRSGNSRGDSWQQNRAPGIQDNYYPPPADIQQGYQNRFGQGPRDYAPPYMNKEAPIYSQPGLPQRQFQDIKPPGVDDDIAPPGVDEPPPQPLQKLSPKHDDKEKDKDKEKERRRSRDRRDRSTDRDRKRRHERKSRTPDKARNPSPKRKSKSKDRDSPDKHKRRRRDSSDRDDRKRDHSDDEKYKKSRDKKKHKDKKESDKKKKRDKKDKHKKESKEKKPKEEFKQVIPKNRDDESEDEIDHKERKRESKEKVGIEDVKSRSEEKHKEKTIEKNESVETAFMEEEDPVKKTKKEVKVKKPKEEVKQPVKEIKKKEIIVEEPVTSTTPARMEYGDLYGDILNEDIDTKVIENYGKIEEEEIEEQLTKLEEKPTQDDDGIEEGEIKELEDEESEEKDVLELHLNDIDLKTELEKSDILAPVPEKSKWEVDEDVLTSPRDSHKLDSKSDKSGKVTNEVLKRAENAIFAKAIKAIRPLEMKKREVEKSNNKIQITVASAIDLSSPPAPQRLSVKERLGVKVDDPDKVINLSRNRSRSTSPFARRTESGRNFDVNERRVELDSLRSRRIGRNRSRSRGRDRSRDKRARVESRGHIRENRRRSTHGRDKTKKEDRSRHDDDRKSRRKRTRSRSESEDKKDKHKKKDKKQKKEKTRKSKDDDDSKTDKEGKDEVKTPVVTKRKPTIDEATFEPDYDLESHSEEEKETSGKKKAAKKQSEEEEDDEKSSSSESDSDSSSEEDRKKKKHKKHKKRKRKESSSSSSSDSESESSDSDRGRKKKKHKKNKKKKKKSKHK